MTIPKVRRLARWAASPPCRRWLGNTAAAFVVLFPILIVSLDHHGAERIASHQHASSTGESVPSHLHGFQVAHVHDTGMPKAHTTAPAIAVAEPIALMVLSLAQDAAMRLDGALNPGNVASYTLVVPARSLIEQTAIAPPTPPPDAAAVSSQSTRMAV